MAAESKKDAATTPDSKTPPTELEVKLRAEIETKVRAELRAEAEAKARGEIIQESGPRYRTKEKCYLKDVLFEVDQEFTWHGVPGYYMLPVNDEAKAKMRSLGMLHDDGTNKEGPPPTIEALTKIN